MELLIHCNTTLVLEIGCKIWVFDCNLDSYCVQYYVFSVSRKQFADFSSIIHHFSSTDESVCRNVTSKFTSNAQKFGGGRGGRGGGEGEGDRLSLSLFHYDVLAFI